MASWTQNKSTLIDVPSFDNTSLHMRSGAAYQPDAADGIGAAFAALAHSKAPHNRIARMVVLQKRRSPGLLAQGSGLLAARLDHPAVVRL